MVPFRRLAGDGLRRPETDVLRTFCGLWADRGILHPMAWEIIGGSECPNCGAPLRENWMANGQLNAAHRFKVVIECTGANCDYRTREDRD